MYCMYINMFLLFQWQMRATLDPWLETLQVGQTTPAHDQYDRERDTEQCIYFYKLLPTLKKKKKVLLKDGKNQERMGKERRRQRDELPDKTIKEQ